MLKQNGKINLAGLSILLIVVVIITGSIFYYLNNRNTDTTPVQNRNVNSEANTNAVVNGNTNIAVDTTGWKTYSNAVNGYSIKYPSSDDISEQTSGDVLIVTKIGSTLNPFIRVTTDNAQSFIDDFSTVTSDTTITVNGQDARRIVGEMPVGGTVLNYLFTKDGKTYALRGIDTTTNESIFQSFTFLADTTGWKTYTNNQYKYSFKYPSNYTLAESNYIKVSNGNNEMSIWLIDGSDASIMHGTCSNGTVTHVGTESTLGYKFTCGDAGCEEAGYQVPLTSSKILQISFSQCDQIQNILFTNAGEQNSILSTFKFTQ